MAKKEAFLSARVPLNIRNNFKTVAVARGLTVQALLLEVIGDYLAEQQKAVPNPAHIVRVLKEKVSELSALGVVKLSLAGSVARGQARLDSDINLVIGFDTDARATPIHVAFIRNLCQGWLGPQNPVDLAVWNGMRDAVAKTLRRDELVIFQSASVDISKLPEDE